ncbi:MAG: C69 family dipeptidase [Gammaproteobacteria bacterium]
MFNTLIIPGSQNSDRATYFAKNSNRETGECQMVVVLPPVENDPATRLRCTHTKIPQESNRHGIILCKPWWTWGGEMGVNDKGVVIGTAQMRTKDVEQGESLLALDLVRLGLERGNSAEDALDVLVSMLHLHGQAGSNSRVSENRRYNSAFLIADHAHAWLLETAGRHWVARKVDSRMALSRLPTIGTDYTHSSYAVEQYSEVKGWHNPENKFNFRKVFGKRSKGVTARYLRRVDEIVNTFLSGGNSQTTINLMEALRYRLKPDNRKISRQDVSRFNRGQLSRTQTNGSMVVRLTAHRIACFVTGTAAPEYSLFKPIYFDQALEPDPGDADLSKYSEDSRWWKHQQFLYALATEASLPSAYLRERGAMERDMVHDILENKGGKLTGIREQIQENFRLWERNWFEKTDRPRGLFAEISPSLRKWKRMSREFSVPI